MLLFNVSESHKPSDSTCTTAGPPAGLSATPGRQARYRKETDTTGACQCGPGGLTSSDADHTSSLRSLNQMLKGGCARATTSHCPGFLNPNVEARQTIRLCSRTPGSARHLCSRPSIGANRAQGLFDLDTTSQTLYYPGLWSQRFRKKSWKVLVFHVRSASLCARI